MDIEKFLLVWSVMNFIIITLILATRYKVGKEVFENHFKNLSKGFFKDEDTIHEPIMFFISNAALIAFLSLAMTFIYDRKISIPQVYFLSELLIYFLYITIVYVLVITLGKVVITLTKRKIYPTIICILVILMFATIALFVRLQ